MSEGLGALKKGKGRQDRFFSPSSRGKKKRERAFRSLSSLLPSIEEEGGDMGRSERRKGTRRGSIGHPFPVNVDLYGEGKKKRRRDSSVIIFMLV